MAPSNDVSTVTARCVNAPINLKQKSTGYRTRGPRLEEYATQSFTLYHRLIAGSGALWDDVGDVGAGSAEHPAHGEAMEAPCRATLWSQSGHFVMAKTLEVEQRRDS